MGAIYACASELLSVAADLLTDPPARRMVDGPIVGQDFACPMLTVYVPANGINMTSSPIARGSANPQLPSAKTWQRRVEYRVRLLSDVCWPIPESDGRAPAPAADIDDHAHDLYDAVEELWTGLGDRITTGPPLFAGILANGNDGVSVANPTMVFGPAGRTVGCEVPVHVHFMRLTQPTGS